MTSVTEMTETSATQFERTTLFEFLIPSKRLQTFLEFSKFSVEEKFT